MALGAENRDLVAMVVLGAVSLAACWVPSKRALGVEPMAVLRLE